MYINSNQNWMRYSSTGDWKLSNIKDGGKWMFFYKDRNFATEMINLALQQRVCNYAKHTKGASGICCFYVSGTSEHEHRKVIKFMLEHNLIRLTSDLIYFDPSFKFNGQSWSKEFGPNFDGLLKLSDFIDLSTGKAIELDLKHKLTITTISKSAQITSDGYLKPLIANLDQFIISYVNDILAHNPDNTDLNDKIIFLAPAGYNLRQLYRQRNAHKFLTVAAHIISYNLKIPNNTQQQKVDKLKVRATTEVINLINFAQDSSLSITDQAITSIDSSLGDRFIANYQHIDLTNDDNYKVLGYLIFLSLLNISKDNIDFITNNVKL